MAKAKQQICWLITALVVLGLWAGDSRPSFAEPVDIVSFDLGDGIQTEDGEGFYGRALTKVLRESSQEFTFSVLPLKRALNAFAEKAADCIWAIDAPTLLKAGVAVEGLVESKSLFTSELHIFMAPGEPAVSEFRELDGKTLGTSIGSPIPKILDGYAIDFFPVRNQDIKVRMLTEHRLDAIAGWTPDILMVFRNNGLAAPTFNPVLPVAKSEVGLVCWRSPATQSFLHAVDPQIVAFRDSNALQAILRESGLEQP